MKKVLVLSYEFYPISSGVVTCLGKILPYLCDKHDVTVLSSTRGKTSNINNYKGARIVRLGLRIDRVVEKKEEIINYLITNKKERKLFGKCVLFVVKVLFYLFTLISERYGYYYRDSFVSNGIKKCDTLIEEADVIIAVAAPHENIEMGCRIKRMYPQKKLIFLLFDMYAYNPAVEGKDVHQKRYEVEKEWYKMADYIIMQPESKTRLMNTDLLGYAKKLDAFPVPSLSIKYGERHDNVNHKGIKLVYTGIFYDKMRNPESMLAFLEKLCEVNDNISIYIAGAGCEEILKKYEKRMLGKLVLLGNLKKEAADFEIADADVLINLSNNVESIVPSKIFEYIGELKPIINFYFIDKDICKKYLSDYDLSLSIKLDEKVSERINEVERFIVDNYQQREDKDNIKERYYMYSADHYAQCLLDEIG